MPYEAPQDGLAVHGPEDEVLIGALRAALGRGKSFSFFDLGGVASRAGFAGLHIGDSDYYDNFGRADRLEADLARFFTGLGNDPAVAGDAAARAARLAGDIREGFNAEAAWVTVRASLPNHDFDVPRWHRDGYFFAPDGAPQRKAAAVLKGASTLLNDISDDLRTRFNTLQGTFAEDTTENRRALAALLDPARTRAVPDGQGLVFAVGAENGAIHSEPPIHEPRLFLSVVPGTAAQIEELRVRWDAPPTRYENVLKP